MVLPVQDPWVKQSLLRGTTNIHHASGTSNALDTFQNWKGITSVAGQLLAEVH